jgi:hypothetical protein
VADVLPDETVSPRNRGLLARDLTEATFSYCHPDRRFNVYDMPETIRQAESAIANRIFDLEQENKTLKARLKRIADWYAAMGAGFQKLGEQESLR